MDNSKAYEKAEQKARDKGNGILADSIKSKRSKLIGNKPVNK